MYRVTKFSLEHFLASRTLLWAEHVARMHKSSFPMRRVLTWIPEPPPPPLSPVPAPLIPCLALSAVE